ncbi:MAG: DNA repair protein RadC [Chloroflexi bacterium]|nr:MAG: DNA repair protein RadC [Chloroflexota bacterium]
MKSVLDMNKLDRPREKLLTKGVAALSEFELLQAIIGSGNKQANVSQIAKSIQKLLVQFGHDIPPSELRRVTGLGSAKISELLAAFELSKRHLIVGEQPIIDSPEKAVEQLADIRDKKQEHFVCLTLDGANRLIAKRIITIGTLTSSLVHPREVFADAITDRAAGIIVAHNHPSGSLKASNADKSVNKRLKEAGELLGVNFIDHLIVTRQAYISLT